ncbi:MAG TPA: PKD domain-containing protein [Firmicutes bacterium]|nr:PKD domain-containing protein [Bacillota bacterium]
MRFFIPILTILAILVASCSGAVDVMPTSPENAQTDLTSRIESSADNSASSRILWGLWEFNADPDAGTLEPIPLRTALFHANVVPFLEPPAGTKLKVSNIIFDDLICDVDVSLTHPFPGMSQFTGFDVTGILISKGTKTGFEKPYIVMPGAGDTRLMNADGLTRWWNPVEFPNTGKILGYVDGMLGNPHAIVNYTATLNGYKVFGDSLGANQDYMTVYNPSSKVVFSSGATNTRHYKIDFAGGIKFNYAVDANWEPAIGSPPFQPDDFPPEAHRTEAWAIEVTEIENTLFNNGSGNSGGGLILEIDVWDHHNAEMNALWADSPGNFDPVTSPTPIGGGEGYSTYEVEIFDATPSFGEIDILIGIESESVGYWDILPGQPETAYFIYTASVSGIPSLAPTAIMEATSPTEINVGETVSFDASASTGTPPLTFEWDFNADGTPGGSGDSYDGDPDKPTHTFTKVGTFHVTVKVSNDWGEDVSDPVAVHVGLDPLDIYVDGDYTGGDSDGSPSKPFLTVQEGMNAVEPYRKVHVDYLDGGDNTYYTDGLVLKSNVVLIGDNWNGGGPGKPKLKNTNGSNTVGTSSNIVNFTLEGFEIGVGEQSGGSSNYGVNIGSWSGNCDNIIIRRNHFTDYVDDTGKTGGVGIPLNMSGCHNSLVEFNEFGPFTWESGTGGVYARVLWGGMYIQNSNNITIKNNFIHDITVDYDGDGNWGQIRVFCLHCYNCNGAYVHNNLICHVKGVNDYDYRIEGMMMEGYSGGDKYQYYNNTIDNLDHSQSNGGFPLRGIFIYAGSATDTFINNTIITYFNTPPGYSNSIQVYYSSPSNLYDISYSTGYNLGTVSNYFVNLIQGNGCTNAPGINPLYVNNTTPPYDYTFQSGSGCEMGDPNFIDWDDSGSPSGDPNETNIENRSRMGCFGGPHGDWDPYDM